MAAENGNSELLDFTNIEFDPGKKSSNKSETLDADRLDLDIQEVVRYRQDTKERKLLSHWVIWVVSSWLLLVMIVVSLNSLLNFKLSDSVLITLLATTTANILGLAYIVLDGLFNLNKNAKKQK